MWNSLKKMKTIKKLRFFKPQQVDNCFLMEGKSFILFTEVILNLVFSLLNSLQIYLIDIVSFLYWSHFKFNWQKLFVFFTEVNSILVYGSRFLFLTKVTLDSEKFYKSFETSCDSFIAKLKTTFHKTFFSCFHSNRIEKKFPKSQ